jgi:hypothetical protein
MYMVFSINIKFLKESARNSGKGKRGKRVEKVGKEIDDEDTTTDSAHHDGDLHTMRILLCTPRRVSARRIYKILSEKLASYIKWVSDPPGWGG